MRRRPGDTGASWMTRQEAKGHCLPDETPVLCHHPKAQPPTGASWGPSGELLTAALQTSHHTPECQGHEDCISSLVKVTLALLWSDCGQGGEALGRRPEVEADPHPGFAPTSKGTPHNPGQVSSPCVSASHPVNYTVCFRSSSPGPAATGSTPSSLCGGVN